MDLSFDRLGQAMEWRKFFRATLFMAFVFSLAAAGPLQAADEKALQSDSSAVASVASEELETLPRRNISDILTVIGSKENVVNLGGSGAYLDSEDIHRFNYDDINRVVRKVPGVYVREEDGYGLFPNISLRGVDPGRSGKITVMEDGVLTAPAPYSDPAAYYSPTTGRMSGIEILKGSSQIKYGPHTTGGVINYLSTPIPDDLKAYVNITSGTDFREDAEFRSHVYVGDTFETGIGKFGWLAEFYQRFQDGFKFIDEKPGIKDPDATGYELYDTMLKFFYEPDTEMYQRLEFKVGDSYRNANETYVGLNTEDFRNNPYRRYAATRFDGIESNQVRTYLRYYAELIPDKLNITSTGYFNHFYRNWAKVNDRIDAAAIPGTGDRLSISEALESPLHLAVLKGDAAGSFRFRENRRYYYGAGLDNVLNYQFDILDTHHNVDFGYRYHQDRVERYQRDITYTQDGEGRITNEALGAPGSGGFNRQHTEAHAWYINDQITWDRLTLTGGLRWEWIQPEFKDKNTGATGKVNYDILAPGVSANYRITDKISGFAGWHRGFSVPGPSAATGASNLREEKSDAYEIGLRLNDNDRALNSEVVWFYTDFDDLLVDDSIGGAGSGMSINAGEVNSQGMEFLLNYDPASHMKKEYRTPSHLAFTFTHARFDSASSSADQESIFSGAREGNEVPYIPDFILSFGTGFEYGKFGIYANGHFIPKMFTSASNTTDQINPVTGVRDARFGETDSHLIFDVAAEYALTDWAKLTMNLYNITDEEYIVSRHPHGPRPGRPFTATAGVKINWG